MLEKREIPIIMPIYNAWITVAGLSGFTAVLLGALGSHAIANRDQSMKETWRIASQYHFIHTLALAYSANAFIGKKRTYTCSLFTAGMLFFSGACYAIVILNERKPVSYLAPIGGFLMMGGWAAMALL